MVHLEWGLRSGQRHHFLDCIGPATGRYDNDYGARLRCGGQFELAFDYRGAAVTGGVWHPPTAKKSARENNFTLVLSISDSLVDIFSSESQL